MGQIIGVEADLDEADSLVDLLERRGEDVRPYLSRVAGLVRESIDEQFATGGHGQWAPLSRATLNRKRRQGKPLQPLVDTGRLRRSLTRPGAEGSLERVQSNGELVLGTTVPYAEYHQIGVPPTPRREIVAVSEELITGMVEAAVEHISDPGRA